MGVGNFTLYFLLHNFKHFTQLETGIDPRVADLRSGSQTGTTTPDVIDRADGAEETPEAGENEEGDEAEGKQSKQEARLSHF